MPGGRPTDYSEELAARICADLAAGRSLRSICEDEDMPSRVTVFRWLHAKPEFCNLYTRARESQMDAMSEEILDIADDGINDFVTKTNKDGSTTEVVDYDHIQRSKLRVDTRKWLMSKLAPKKFGERTEIQHNATGELAGLLAGLKPRVIEPGR